MSVVLELLLAVEEQFVGFFVGFGIGGGHLAQEVLLLGGF